jgi:hypothetical protein
MGSPHHSSVQVGVDVVASGDAVQRESIVFECAGQVAGGDPARDIHTFTAMDSIPPASGPPRPEEGEFSAPKIYIQKFHGLGPW